MSTYNAYVRPHRGLLLLGLALSLAGIVLVERTTEAAPGTWRDLGQPPGATEIRSLVVYNTQLYAGTAPNGTVWRYDGTQGWTSVGQPGGSTTQRINALAVHSGSLYAAVGPQARVLRYAGGTTWVEGDIQLDNNGEVAALALHADGALYAGLTQGAKTNRLLPGTPWTKSGILGATNASPQVTSLLTFIDNKLYGARSDNAPGVFVYNGGIEWLSRGAPNGIKTINSLAAFQNLLHIATGDKDAEIFSYDHGQNLWQSKGVLGTATSATEMAATKCFVDDCPTGYTQCNNECIPVGVPCQTPLPTVTPVPTPTPTPPVCPTVLPSPSSTVSPSGSVTPLPSGSGSPSPSATATPTGGPGDYKIAYFETMWELSCQYPNNLEHRIVDHLNNAVGECIAARDDGLATFVTSDTCATYSDPTLLVGDVGQFSVELDHPTYGTGNVTVDVHVGWSQRLSNPDGRFTISRRDVAGNRFWTYECKTTAAALCGGAGTVHAGRFTYNRSTNTETFTPILASCVRY
jgi:hypothetical protein